MFNFSANHMFLLSRTEYQKCAVFLLQDLDTQRVYGLYDFTKALLLRPGVAYSVARHRAFTRRVHVRPRPAPPRACVSRFRPAVFLTTKPAILRAFYIGTNRH
jgi:hypothetical protein